MTFVCGILPEFVVVFLLNPWAFRAEDGTKERQRFPCFVPSAVCGRAEQCQEHTGSGQELEIGLTDALGRSGVRDAVGPPGERQKHPGLPSKFSWGMMLSW